MKKKIIIITILIIFLLTGCNKKEENNNNNNNNNNNAEAIKFKQEFEELNENYLGLSVVNNNPFVYKSYDDINNMINNKETFLVFIGRPDNNYSRSIVEPLISSSKDNDLEVIYFVDNDFGMFTDLLNQKEIIPIVFNVLNGKIESITKGYNKYKGEKNLTDEIRKENYDILNPLVKDTIDTINTCNSEC